MGRVGRSLITHELLERTRDRWVLVVSVLFALLSIGTSLYGRGSGGESVDLTGPSLVTLISLLLPLVGGILGHDAIVGERERNTLGLLLSLPVSRAEVIIAKFIGRLIALAGAVFIGLGGAALVGGFPLLEVALSLFGPTMLLGASFLSIGILVSCVTTHQVTAASTMVALWFLFVFFYDLGLLGMLIATDGWIPQEVIGGLVYANPAGLFRVQMLAHFTGPEVLETLGMTVGLPSLSMTFIIWLGWILSPIFISVAVLNRLRNLR
jgi:Cu-processing system permease protein